MRVDWILPRVIVKQAKTLIKIFTISKLKMVDESFQLNQQYDTLLPIVPCTHKLKAGIAY
jgi:hypothetical protein